MHFSFENLMFDLIWWEDRWLIVIDLCNLMPKCNLQFFMEYIAYWHLPLKLNSFRVQYRYGVFNIHFVRSVHLLFYHIAPFKVIVTVYTKKCTVYSRINPNSDQTELNKMLYFRRFKSAPSVIHILIVIDCVLHETAHNLIVRLWSIPIFFDMNKQYFS